MSKEMLDVLSDQKKIEEIIALPTSEDVKEAFKKEGVSDVTSKDVEILGNVFKTVSEKGAEAVDEKLLASVGGGVKIPILNRELSAVEKSRLKKAAAAAVVIGGAIGTGCYGYNKGWFGSKNKPSVGGGDGKDIIPTEENKGLNKDIIPTEENKGLDA